MTPTFRIPAALTADHAAAHRGATATFQIEREAAAFLGRRWAAFTADLPQGASPVLAFASAVLGGDGITDASATEALWALGERTPADFGGDGLRGYTDAFRHTVLGMVARAILDPAPSPEAEAYAVLDAAGPKPETTTMPSLTTAAIAYEFAAQPKATRESCAAYFIDAASLYEALADLGETLDAAVAEVAREDHTEPADVWDRLDFYLTVDDLVARFTTRTIAGCGEFSPYSTDALVAATLRERQDYEERRANSRDGHA